MDNIIIHTTFVIKCTEIIKENFIVDIRLKGFITYGAKLLNADWLRRRGFFPLITRALLVIKRALLLDPDWLTVAYSEQAKLQ